MKQIFKSQFLLFILLLITFHFSNAQTIIYNDAYDLTNGYTFEGSYTITDENTPTDLTFSPDGNKMYIVGKFTDKVFQYNLSTPFDVTSTVTLDGSKNVALGLNENPTGIAFNGDGTVLFSIGDEYNRILTWNLSTPYNITDGLVQDGSSGVSSFEATPEAIAFSSDGNKRYVLGRSGDDINQTNNSFPYSLNFGSNGAFSVSSETLAPYGMAISADDKIILVSSFPNIIQYSLSTAGEVISGVSLDATFFNYSVSFIPQGIAYNDDGTKFYILIEPSSGSGSVSQYSINTANENFTESDLADGSVDGSASIRISGETFNSAGSNLSLGTDFNITNLPTGLVPVIAINADGKLATLTFTGNAVSSLTSDNVASIEISFANSAFVGNDASSVSNALNASTGFGINFFGDASAPTNIILSNSNINENEASGTVVGILSTTDMGVGATYTYTLVAGNGSADNGAFSIAGDKLKSAALFDFETKASYSIRINTDDGNGGDLEKEFTISIMDVSENPTGLALNKTSIDENEALGTVVGILSTRDADAGETYDYTLVKGSGSKDNASFTIEDNKLKSAVIFDFETKDTYSVRINTNDGNGGDFSKEFVISINDLAEMVTWNGTSWSNGSGPLATDNVVINGNYSIDLDGAFDMKSLIVNTGFTVTIDDENTLDIDGDLTNNGSIVVESGSTLLTYDANAFAGNDIEIQRDTRYTDGKYSFVGSPVAQSSSTTASDLGSNVHTYDEALSPIVDDESRWVDANGTDQLEVGRGYTQAFQKEIVFFGTPNTGTITYSGTYANDGWHLVSNPYAAAIFIDDFLDANLNTTDAVYIWDDNNSQTGRGSNDDYIVANKTGATDINDPDNDSRWNDHIGSAQGFMVKLDGAAGNITFTESMRRSDKNADNSFFRKNESKKPLVRLNLRSAEGLHKQAIVGWNNDVSDNEISEGYDAAMFSTKADYAIFTEKSDIKLTIQTVTASKIEIPLGVNVAEGGTYQIEISIENGYSGSLYLHDAVTEEQFDLTQGVFSFTTNSGQITERFTLSTISSVLGLGDSERNIYTFGKTLFINSDKADLRNYQLYNLSGKLMLKTKVSGSAQLDLSMLPNGIYLVSDGIDSKKVILK